MVASAAGGEHTLVRPWLGTKTDAVTRRHRPQPRHERAVRRPVTDLYPGNPAERAGIRVGDVIVGVDGGEVADPGNLNYRIATKAPGEATKVELLRDGKRVGVTVRYVEPPPATPAKDEQTLSGRNPLSDDRGQPVAGGGRRAEVDPFVKDSGVLISGVASRGAGIWWASSRATSSAPSTTTSPP